MASWSLIPPLVSTGVIPYVSLSLSLPLSVPLFVPFLLLLISPLLFPGFKLEVRQSVSVEGDNSKHMGRQLRVSRYLFPPLLLSSTHTSPLPFLTSPLLPPSSSSPSPSPSLSSNYSSGIYGPNCQFTAGVTGIVRFVFDPQSLSLSVYQVPPASTPSPTSPPSPTSRPTSSPTTPSPATPRPTSSPTAAPQAPGTGVKQVFAHFMVCLPPPPPHPPLSLPPSLPLSPPVSLRLSSPLLVDWQHVLV